MSPGQGFSLRSKVESRSAVRLVRLTPLIDIVFILLVFFMLASSFMDWRSISLGTPSIRSGPSSGMEGALLLRVHADGSVDLSGRRMSVEELGSALSAQLQQDPDRRILVRPMNDVPLQKTVRVLDEISATGGRNIALSEQ
ncbi:ExbD/TolR family protein [Fodinicurvata fenggangensis]|uniref:ExbD/TolR family protein n=1 Tax=Fodinicurvata fenggangensis TaxID=1121830 RepID=UPI000689E632|nr:biopolymer transporter ExbD [Fodinicurvata fenggangensis]